MSRPLLSALVRCAWHVCGTTICSDWTYGTELNALACSGRPTVKCRWSNVAISVCSCRSAGATRLASVPRVEGWHCAGDEVGGHVQSSIVRCSTTMSTAMWLSYGAAPHRGRVHARRGTSAFAITIARLPFASVASRRRQCSRGRSAGRIRRFSDHRLQLLRDLPVVVR